MGGRLVNVASISRGIGSFLDTAVVEGAAEDEDDVDVASSWASPTLTVTWSTCSGDEPLPNKSFSLPALAHDVAILGDGLRRLTGDGFVLELAGEDRVADGGETGLGEHDGGLHDGVCRARLSQVLDSLADAGDPSLYKLRGVSPACDARSLRPPQGSGARGALTGAGASCTRA